jgi:DNA polymerase-3 subunit delta'
MDLDQEPGAPHPRETYAYTGHDEAEAALADALNGGRMHHAWLLAGPKGVGKATLAYRFARAALGARRIGPRPFDCAPDDPVARRIGQLSHGDLHVLRRGLNDRGRPRSEITVDDARSLIGFFSLKATEGGWRVAIVDAADELNRNAANAILKTLEEPPPRTVLLLVAHAPGALLPTIRSRCRRLDLRPLDDPSVSRAVETATGATPDAAAARFAGGRPGRAIALAAAGADDVFAVLAAALNAAPKGSVRTLLPEAFKPGDRDARLSLLLALTRDWIRRAIAAGAGVEAPSGAEAALMARLAPPAKAARWAEAYEALLALEREADGLEMDPTHAFARAARILERAAA